MIAIGIFGLAAGILLGAIPAAIVSSIFGFGSGWSWHATLLLFWLPFGSAGAILGIRAGRWATSYTFANVQESVAGPRSIVRTTNLISAIAILSFGDIYIWLLGTVESGNQISKLLLLGLLWGIFMGLQSQGAILRYFALLLLTRRWNRHWPPWRLGHFLHWRYEAGLVRVAGLSYQFRHQKLQNYLARHQDPVS